MVAEQPAHQKRDNVGDGAHDLLEPRELTAACRALYCQISIDDKYEDDDGDDCCRVAFLIDSDFGQSKQRCHADRGGIDPDKLEPQGVPIVRMQGDVGNGGDSRGPSERREAIKRGRQDDLAKALRRPLYLRLPRCPVAPGTNRRSNKEVARDYKEDLVGPASKQVNEPQQSRIGEGGECRIFWDTGADSLEGPLKGMEYRDASYRDQA